MKIQPVPVQGDYFGWVGLCLIVLGVFGYWYRYLCRETPRYRVVD